MVETLRQAHVDKHTPHDMHSHSSQEVSHMRLPPEITSLESTLVYAEDVASFLKDNENTIIPRLEEELLKLGYTGDYRLQAGFDEEMLYDYKATYPVVFLSLSGIISHDLQTVSRALSPLFAPYSTRVITQSETHDLLSLPELIQPDVEELNLYPDPVSIYQLSSKSSEQTLPEEGQNLKQGSIQASSGQGYLSMNKNERGDDVEGRSDRRSLELELNLPLKKVDKDGNSFQPNILSNIQTNIMIELGDGQNGDYRPEGVPLPAHKELREPWCFLNFSELVIRGDATNNYSLAAVHVHVEATPMGTLCKKVFPETLFPTRQGYNGIETVPHGWSATTFDARNSAKDVQEVDIDYYASKVAPDLNSFGSRPGPHVIFSSEPNRRRILRIWIQAIWTEKPTDLSKRPFRRDSDSFRNFLHRFFVEIDLDQMKKGNVTAWSGNTLNAAADIVPESWEASEVPEQMRVVVLPQAAATPARSGEGPRYRIEFPVESAVIDALKDGSVACGFRKIDAVPTAFSR